MSVGVVVVFPCVCVEGLEQSHMSAGAKDVSRQPNAGNFPATPCRQPQTVGDAVPGACGWDTKKLKHCTVQALRKKNKQQAPPATTGAVKRLPLPRCQEEDAFATAVATAATTASRGTSCRRPQVTTQGIDDAYLGDANEVYGNLRYV